MNKGKQVAATVLMATAITMGPTVATANAPEPPKRSWWMKTPCHTEDQVNCFWNAKEQGNGKGQSYYVRQFPGKAKMICVMYVKKTKRDYCISNAKPTFRPSGHPSPTDPRPAI